MDTQQVIGFALIGLVAGLIIGLIVGFLKGKAWSKGKPILLCHLPPGRDLICHFQERTGDNRYHLIVQDVLTDERIYAVWHENVPDQFVLDEQGRVSPV